MACNHQNGRDRAWTHEECLDAGRRWVQEYGEPPTRSELNPAMLRSLIRRTERRLEQLHEREQRFEVGQMPGAEVVARLFGGMNPYLHALGFTPRGTGRPPRTMAREHRAQAPRALATLGAGHRTILAFLQRSVQAPERELRYQRRHDKAADVDRELDELEAAGLVEAVVTVSYRLTDDGRQRLAADHTPDRHAVMS